MRAASDCETQASATIFFLEKVVELFNLFRLCFDMGVSHYPRPGSVELFQSLARVKQLRLVFQTGRVGAINTDAPLTTITSLGGNDGCYKK